MNAWKRNKMSIVLVVGSLLLLLLFQMFWLKNVYEIEKESLVEEADQVFLNAVRTIEDSLFKEIWMTPLQHIQAIESDSMNVNVDWKKNGAFKVLIDQTKEKVSNFSKINNTDYAPDVQIDIRSNLGVGKTEGAFGSYTFMMASQKDISLDTIIAVNNKDTTYSHVSLNLIQKEISRTFQTTSLPNQYKVLVLKDENEIKSGLLSNTHKDVMSQKIFAIHFPQYKGHILKKITPQILFSIFLFGSIALSFFMVWKSLEKQRQLTELKNDFISNVTHELKTPITTVGVALEALSNFNALQNPERTEEYLNISKHELSRLSILVDKVLKMSMFEKKEPELKIEMLDMQGMIQEVLSSMKLQFEKVSAQVDFQAKGNSFLLHGDKIHLTSVIYNLIDNALKYSLTNPEISLLLENTSDLVQLTIADKGIGISNDNQYKIFEKFFRVPQGDQHNVKGYGLGLSYVASVIKKHNGDIKVNSELDKGTRFIISLPNKR